MRTVTNHEENEKDLVEIPKNIIRKLDIHPDSEIDEVLKLALTEMPKAIISPAEAEKTKPAEAETAVRTH